MSARPIGCLDAVSPDPLGGELPAEGGFEWCESRGVPHLPPPWGFRLTHINRTVHLGRNPYSYSIRLYTFVSVYEYV